MRKADAQILINLLPGHEKAEENRQILAVFCGVLAVLLVFMAVGYQLQNNKLKQQIYARQELEKKMVKYAGVKKKLAAVKGYEEQVALRQKMLETANKNRGLATPVLIEIEKAVPEQAVLSSIQCDGGKITVTGSADSNETVARLVAYLSASPRVKRVLNLSSGIAENGRYAFSLQCEWGGDTR